MRVLLGPGLCPSNHDVRASCSPGSLLERRRGHCGGGGSPTGSGPCRLKSLVHRVSPTGQLPRDPSSHQGDSSIPLPSQGESAPRVIFPMPAPTIKAPPQRLLQNGGSSVVPPLDLVCAPRRSPAGSTCPCPRLNTISVHCSGLRGKFQVDHIGGPYRGAISSSIDSSKREGLLRTFVARTFLPSFPIRLDIQVSPLPSKQGETTRSTKADKTWMVTQSLTLIVYTDFKTNLFWGHLASKFQEKPSPLVCLSKLPPLLYLLPNVNCCY